jgi:hypothetical protein
MLTRAAVFVSLLFMAGLTFSQEQSNSPAQSKSSTPVKVVAQIALHNQTEAIPETVLYTPDHDGLYRVSAYVVVLSAATPNLCSATGASSEPLIFDASYTDDSGVRQTPSGAAESWEAFANPFSGGPGNYLAGARVFQVKAGKPITYRLDVLTDPRCPIDDPLRYTLFVALERLF